MFVLNITINIFQSYSCDHLSYNSARVALKTLPLFSVYIHTIILIVLCARLGGSNDMAYSDAQTYQELKCLSTW